MLSVYVHIPYCLQRCRYCDFTTFEQSEILPPDQYTAWVVQEIRNRQALWSEREIATLYFGGGTPSLIAPELIVAIRRELAIAGFKFTPDCETTLEINPATLDEAKLQRYLEAGFNRFSVGAQTFDDALLKSCGRKHSAADTRETLKLLQKYKLNYSFDLLFALPGQTLAGLVRDLDEVAGFAPPHLSAYCLTVPEGHAMSFGRPPEDEQVEMFAVIERRLDDCGLKKYEISNFARPGFESRHNMAYWSDVSYWGLGLSSHSYRAGDGMRFWNPKILNDYGEQTARQAENFTALLPKDQFEILRPHETLTDFFHMFLRTMRGLPQDLLLRKVDDTLWPRLNSRLERLISDGLLMVRDGCWTLTPRGQMISNQVFSALTFLQGDLASPTA